MHKAPNTQMKVFMTGCEMDVVHPGWRRLYCYLNRAGATSKIKRGLRVKVRRTARTQIKEGKEE